MKARRYQPAELGSLDLTIHDERIAWAKSARASSDWSSSYAASTACGPPSVFPKGGDENGTWLATSNDRSPHLEVTFAAPFTPLALVVCETCGPGGITVIRDRDTNHTLYSAQAAALEPAREARLLVVPLDPDAPAPRRVRIELKNVGGDYQEIDAVGLIAVPIEELIASPPVVAPKRHRRYRPDEVSALRFRDDHRIVWAKRAEASSEWSERYAAKAATGAPNVFPQAGDHDRTWLSQSDDRDAWLELEFDNDQPVHGFLVAETCGAGATVRAEDGDGKVMWQARPEEIPERQARLLHVAVDGEPILRKLRLHVSPTVTDYREIDAVALITAPFDELSSPPPPPPIPGAPRGGFTMLSGTLVGASIERPVAHVVVATRRDVQVVSTSGPLALRLADGSEVALELEEATVYGPPLMRRRGAWAEVAQALPWLAQALGANPPDANAAVEVHGRAISLEAEVHVAGTASGRQDGGFRQAAAVPERLSVRALSMRPLEHTDFVAEGTASFRRRDARPLAPSRATAHPYDGWLRGMGGVAVAGLGAAAVLFGALELGLTTSGWATGIGTLGLSVGLLAVSFVLELAFRRATPLVVERGRWSKRNGRIRLPRPIWTLVYTLLFLGLFIVLFAVAAGTAEVGPDAGVLGIAPVFAGLHALVRLPFCLWSSGSALFAATRVALAAPTARGLLDDDVSVQETHTEHSKHLGTEQVVDAQGRVTTRDNYRTWTTREVRVSGEPALIDPTGATVQLSPLRIVPVGAEPQPTHGATTARIDARYAFGDPVLVFGVRGADDRVKGDVVLGELAPLRRAVLTAWASLFGLVLVAAGVLPFLLALQ